MKYCDEREYNGKIYYTFKANYMGMNESFVVEKIHPDTKTIETKYGTKQKTSVKIGDEYADFWIPELQQENWESIPVGLVKITKKKLDGNKHTYEYSVADEDEKVIETVEPLSSKQIAVLKAFVEAKKSGGNANSQIMYGGKMTTYKEVLGADVINNPSNYLPPSF